MPEVSPPRTRPLAPLPTSPDDPLAVGPGLIVLTVAEIKREFNLTTRAWHTIRYHLCWSWWKHRHQARARRYHPSGQTRTWAISMIRESWCRSWAIACMALSMRVAPTR
jgi:hypothetical protein